MDADPKQFVDIVTTSFFPVSFYQRWGGALAGRDPGSPMPNPFMHSAQLSNEAAQAAGLDLPVAKTIARGSS